MIKTKKLLAAMALSLAFAAGAFAELPENLTFSITTDFAYYPASEKIVNNPNAHFAPLTGPYSGLEGRVTGNATYTIATPLGSHWLLSGANVALNASFEVSPVSVKPGLSVAFTPLPFLVFSAGAQAGTGWDLAGMDGMSAWNYGTNEYDDLATFKNWYLKWYAQGTFQFDTGAVIPGDWTHVVLQYTYQVYYEKITGVSDTDVWQWQVSGNKVNGLKNYQSFVLAYQMPLKLYRVGLLAEIDGYYDDAAYKNADFSGSFKSISISPLAQIKFNEHNTLSILLGFSSRRSYDTAVADGDIESKYNFVSREWYFNRIALSYSYTF